MREPVRVGVVGCGFFARNHIQSWLDLSGQGAKLVAVCDSDRSRADKCAAEFGIGVAYGDIETMLSDAKIDLVDIVTQVGSHRPLVESAINCGVAAIVQKPFGLSLEDCRAMTDHADARDTLLSVHENFRFQRPSRLIQSALENGLIGQPNWGRIAFRTGYDVFTGQPYLRDEPRFVVMDLGVHVLDLARYFFGEVNWISAELQTRLDGVQGEDTATMLLRHKSGAVSVVECTYASFQDPDPFPATLIEIEGSKGGLRLDSDLCLTISGPEGATRSSADTNSRAWGEKPWHVVQDSVYQACAHFLEGFRSGIPAETSAADNLKTFALCEAAYTSAATHAAVKPDY